MSVSVLVPSTANHLLAKDYNVMSGAARRRSYPHIILDDFVSSGFGWIEHRIFPMDNVVTANNATIAAPV